MNEKSRIRFNPATREVEIEGTEAFVKTFFSKVEALMSMSAPMAKKAAKPARAKVAPAKKRKKGPQVKASSSKKVGTTKAKETLFDTIVGLIQDSRGITTGELQDKTGMTKKQIWSITYRAEKIGKIKRSKKGIYEAAG